MKTGNLNFGKGSEPALPYRWQRMIGGRSWCEEEEGRYGRRIKTGGGGNLNFGK